MSKLRTLLENIKDDFSNYSETLDVFFRDTANDLSVYSTTDPNTDKVVCAMNKIEGIYINSSDFKRSNGKTHFIKKPSTFEETKNKVKNMMIDRKSINIIHLDKLGVVIQ